MSAPLDTPTPSDATGARREADAALCRGALYAAVALGFGPVTAATVRALARPAGAAALVATARALEALEGIDGFAACVARLAEPRSGAAALSAAHRRLFGHTARGPVPAYETEYGNEALFQQPQELGDLAGFMAAFGLTLRREAHERIDHVSCECEFLAFLSYKEAYAIESGDAEMRSLTARAATLFLRDHLGRFAPAFARRLERNDPGGFYNALGRVLLLLVARDCERLGVPLGDHGLALRPDPSSVAAPMGCAAPGEGGCPSGGCA
jgi:TorA maturation chaperone TorD